VIPAGPRATIRELATSDAILVVGDVTEEVPVLDLRIKDALKGIEPPELLPHGVPIADLRLKERATRRRERLAVAAPYRVDLMGHAGAVARYRAGGEEAFFRALTAVARGAGDVDEGALGADRPVADALVERLRGADAPVLVLGGFVVATKAAADAAAAFAKAVDAKTMILGPMADSFGLELTGVLPSHERYAYPEMLAGGVKALIVSNLDPASDARVAETLSGLDLLVSHTCFHDATTAIAHVVLPAKTGYEKDGSTINLEGRLLSLTAAPVENGVAEDFTGVVKRLGEALGTRLDGRSVRSGRRALTRKLGLDFEALGPAGLLLKRAARAQTRVTLEKDEAVAGNLLLVPSMTRIEYLDRNPHLRAASGDVRLRLHPAQAEELGLKRDDVVSLQVDGVRRRALVQPTEDAPEGLMLLAATPDQPTGLAGADLSSLVKERDALEVAV
jgi:NADH-quinone oxidoreductase subunit G